MGADVGMRGVGVDVAAESAIEIFKEKDYGEVTVREIVARAGSSPSTFYRYSKTKEDLYSDILDAWLNKYMAAWEPIFPLYTDDIKGYRDGLETTRVAINLDLLTGIKHQ